MQKSHEIYIKSGFLPSVKIKPLDSNKSRSRRVKTDNMGIYFRSKLKINDQSNNSNKSRQIPELIQDYYKRFKMNIHVAQPLSVSINFKQVTQKQLQFKAAEISQKIKQKSTKKKHVNLVENSYTQELCKKKSKQVINSTNNADFSNNKPKLCKISCMPINRHSISENKLSKQYVAKSLQFKQNLTRRAHQNKYSTKNTNTISHEPQHQPSHQSQYQQNLNQFFNKQVSSPSKCQMKNQSTAFWALQATKKSKSRFKSVYKQQYQKQKHRVSVRSKKLTPWLYNQIQNSQEIIQLLQKSVHNSIQI